MNIKGRSLIKKIFEETTKVIFDGIDIATKIAENVIIESVVSQMGPVAPIIYKSFMTSKCIKNTITAL